MDQPNEAPTLPARSPSASRAGLGAVCTQCQRQKQKCDRQYPCANCVRRRVPHLCMPSSGSGGGHKRSRLSSVVSTSPSATSTTPAVPAFPVGLTQPRETTASSLNPEASQPQNSIGNLWNSRGAPSYHGNSYFGHQAVAGMMQAPSPDLPVGINGIHSGYSRRTGAIQSFRNENGPYSQLWEFVGYVPRQKPLVDNLTRRFLDELNPAFDAVHEETFMIHYEKFWDRRWGHDDLTTIDLRWLSLLFIMIAFAELLNCPQPCSPEAQRDCEESSLHFFWASRKCVVIAPTFSGESPDLVRAGILISRYLVHLGRKSESWLTTSFAVRMSQAQGMHVDGESWRLPRKVSETRRRLWSHLVTLDRTISLAVGRPYAINDKHCMEMNITNIWVDDMTAEEAISAEPQPLNNPTPGLYHLYSQKLARIIGQIHDECFALAPMTTSYSTYDKILSLDRILLSWRDTLPPYFQLEGTDYSLDVSHLYLHWHRLYLHSAYHFARITLHRTYVLLPSITDRFQYSRDACISSACADLKVRLSFNPRSMADRLRFNVAPHHLFNSALVLGIIAVRDPFSHRTEAILQDLQGYCEKQNADGWANEFGLAEVKVVELCIASVKKSRKEATVAGQQNRRVSYQMRSVTPETHTGAARLGSNPMQFENDTEFGGIPNQGTNLEIGEDWLDTWFGFTRNFPEPLDFETWEGLVGDLETRR